ncbi:hypothetical protein [Gordonia sp. NB41Y]|uniref:hypothetical protein n=1 Tax=Gordonia sp. NB41Y TaxID=875808 RepID=UPI0006B1679B|nr:hypothetical protein [Gordonia sp. NB41Y]KOY49192.1 hypothetical protein ISGA_11785 [Gordonia sp. NB41Y]WLP92051.1 hypothetical protein Q9K23_07370 [Gordonia sp. NB41Y]
MANKQPRRPGYRPKVAGTRRPTDAADTTAAEKTVPAKAVQAKAVPEAAVESTTDVAETPAEITEVIEPPADSGDPDSGDPDSTGDAESSTISLTKPDNGSGDADDADADDADAGDADADDVGSDEATAGRPAPTGKTRTVARVSTIKPQARPAASSSRSTRPARAPRPGRTSGSGLFSTRLIAILAGVAAVLAVVAVILGFHPGVTIGENKAFIDQTATTDLTAQAQTKVCTAIAADGTKVDQWAGKARAVLTGQALKEFNDYLPTQKQLLDQTKAVAECRVDVIGVRDLTGNGDGATAVVLANLVVSESVNGQATNSGTPRTQLHMVKQGDQWLISQVEAV